MSPPAESKINRGWRTLFAELRLDPARGLHFVSADQLNDLRNRIAGVDARNMVKFDARARMPRFLRELGYFVLPVSNGRYALVRGDGFHDLEPPPVEAERFVSRLGFAQDIPTTGGESAALDYAFNAGLIEHHFGLTGLHLTVRGRRRTEEPFRFMAGCVGPLEVSGVQIELDAGYESAGDFVIVEAKIDRPADFHVRQLFYPWRAAPTWVPGKHLHPAFFVFERATGEFCLWNYEFTDTARYGTMRLLRCRRYRVVAPRHERVTFTEVADRVPARAAIADWAIPQANDFDKVARVPFLVAEGVDTSGPMAWAFGFTERQSNYYRAAAEILGLVRTDPGHVTRLTPIGHQYVRTTVVERAMMLASLILGLPVMRELLNRLASGPGITEQDIAELLMQRTSLNRTTSRRRASTLRSWLAWTSEHLGVVRVERGRIVGVDAPD